VYNNNPRSKRTVILATTGKHTGTGKKLQDMDAWKNADTKKKQKEVKAKAAALAIAQNKHHADTHGFVHTCVGFIYFYSLSYLIFNFTSDTNNGNVLFHEDENGLHLAHFVDWGLGKDAVKGADGEYNKKTKSYIVGFSFPLQRLVC
jgi:hypothetical protein